MCPLRSTFFGSSQTALFISLNLKVNQLFSFQNVISKGMFSSKVFHFESVSVVSQQADPVLPHLETCLSALVDWQSEAFSAILTI